MELIWIQHNSLFYKFVAILVRLILKVSFIASDGENTEAAEAFRKWRGIGQKGHFCI